MASKDDLMAAIGNPPTTEGTAAAILLATSAPVVAEPAPADHGLDPTDPAVTQVPRDETTPTPGVDLPPVDSAAVTVDKAKVAADEAQLTADEAQLATDEAAESATA